MEEIAKKRRGEAGGKRSTKLAEAEQDRIFKQLKGAARRRSGAAGTTGARDTATLEGKKPAVNAEIA